ncbi:MAG TPA: putative quinol monooxygenase [Acidobacteriaceae bacterium]
MLSFTVRLRFEEGDHDSIAESLRQLTAGSRQEPGCITYVAHFVVDDPMTVLIYEQYMDEVALEYHRNTPHFQEYAGGGLYKLKHTRQMEYLTVVA